MVRLCRIRVAAVPMCYPQIIRSRQLMRYDGDNTLQYQDNREGLRTLPLNAMECGYFRSMLRKAERRELHLHKSVFGILKRGRGQRDV
jgi:hypothetical protein